MIDVLRRAVISAVQAGKKMQVLQVVLGKSGKSPPIDEVEHFEPLGITAVPVAGAEAVVADLGGTHPVVLVASDRRHRPKDLGAGETSVYNCHGHEMRLEDDRAAIVSPSVRLGSAAATAKVAREGDAVTITRASNVALFAILDAAALVAGLPVPPAPGAVNSIAGTITSGSTVTRSD